MLDFNKYFNDEYQFTLKNVSFSWIENNNNDNEVDLIISDSVDAAINEAHLDVTFERKVFFNPESLFTISVSFLFGLTFKESVTNEEVKSINWNEVLVESENPYLGNVISRASNLIATLTSSYGQQPLITPPIIVKS